jgi:hypothetical protein
MRERGIRPARAISRGSKRSTPPRHFSCAKLPKASLPSKPADYIARGWQVNLAYRSLLESGAEPKDENAVNLAKAYSRASHHFLIALEKSPGNTPYLAAVRAAREGQSLSPRSAFPQAAKEAPYLRPGMSVQQFSELLPEHGREAALLYVLGVLTG